MAPFYLTPGGIYCLSRCHFVFMFLVLLFYFFTLIQVAVAALATFLVLLSVFNVFCILG